MSCSCEIEGFDEESDQDQYGKEPYEETKVNVNKSEKGAELYQLMDFFFTTLDTGDLVQLMIDITSHDKTIVRHYHRGKQINLEYQLDHFLNDNVSHTSNRNFTTQQYKEGLLFEILKLNDILTHQLDPYTIIHYSISTPIVEDIATLEYRVYEMK